MPSMKKLAAAAATVATVSAIAPAPSPTARIPPSQVPVNAYTNELANGAPFLNNIAQSKGKLWFGTAADVPGAEQQDTQYMTILNNTKIFGQITPANAMKWEIVEPEQNVFDYTQGDVSVDIAEDHGKYLRCHNLNWDNENPQWLLTGIANGTINAKNAPKILQNHISNVVGHWGGRCFSWDVVNEANNGTGGWDTNNPWYQVIGPSFFQLAFKYAEQAANKLTAPIQLIYNDYGIETAGPRATGTMQKIQTVLNAGIRVDGIGFESHFEVGGTPSTAALVSQMEAYINQLNVDIYITELDIRFVDVATQATGPGYAQQAIDYYNVIAACMQVERCKGITVWDFDDQYSWVPATFPGQGAADIYNGDLSRKPAYQAIANAMNGVPCGAPCKGAKLPAARK